MQISRNAEIKSLLLQYDSLNESNQIETKNRINQILAEYINWNADFVCIYVYTENSVFFSGGTSVDTSAIRLFSEVVS